MDFTRCYSCMQELNRSDSRCSHCGCDNITVAKAQPSHALPCGYLLHGKYVIGKTLGQGGFGVTYIGWDLALETRVCIKEYFPAGAAMRSSTMSTSVTWSGGSNAEELKRGRDSFIKEARKAAKLRKLSGVVQVWDVFFENDTAYLVMDYVEGVTLKNHLIQTRKPLSEGECVRLLAPVMKDLEEVHARGIIHRDISPDNLMLRPDGTLVLLDIGAAKDLSTGSGQSSMLVAKHGFSPLEQYASGGKIGPWTDVYAMCATIVYCTTGKLVPTPMERVNDAELDLNRFSSAFAKVLEQGLAVNPENRIQSMQKLLDAIENARTPNQIMDSGLDPDPTQDSGLNNTSAIQAESTPEYKSSPKVSEKRKTIVPIIALAILLIVGIIFFAPRISAEHTKKSEYAQAEELMNSGKYEQAIEAFEKLGDYQDAADRAKEAQYIYAGTLVISGKYDQAAIIFRELGDYQDADSRADEAQYAYAEALRKSGDLEQALSAFQELGEYKDASEQVGKIKDRLYKKAKTEIKDEQFEEAATVLELLGDYRDASVLAQEYRQIADHISQPEKEGTRWGTTCVKRLKGKWSDEKVDFMYRYTYPMLFTGPVTDCEDLSMDFAFADHSGDCYGLWILYLQDMDGAWNPAGLFNVNKEGCEINKTYCFHFSKPQSFQAAAVLPTAMDERPRGYSVSNTSTFYVPCQTKAEDSVVFPSDPSSFIEGYEVTINGHYAKIHLLDHIWENCEAFIIPLEMRWLWGGYKETVDVYIREPDGKWTEVGAIKILDEELNEYSFHLDEPCSFDAVALRARHAGQFIFDAYWCVCPVEELQ